MKEEALCFICHGPIAAGEPRSNGHVIPRCFFPSAFRNQPGVQLPTLPAHPCCDRAFSKDEDYLRHSLGSLTFGTPLGDLLYEDLRAAVARPEARALYERIKGEFGNVIETGTGAVTKRIDTSRLQRVLEKTVRGMVAYHTPPAMWVHHSARLRFSIEGGREQMSAFGRETVLAFLATESIWPKLAPVADVRWVSAVPRAELFGIGLWSKLLVIGTVEWDV